MLLTDKFWLIRWVVRKIISSSEGGTLKLRPKAFSAAKRCLVAVAYPDWVSAVTLELKAWTAFSMVVGCVPIGRANRDNLRRGWGFPEYFGLPLSWGNVIFLFLLSKSNKKPFLFPLWIKMHCPVITKKAKVIRRYSVIYVKFDFWSDYHIEIGRNSFRNFEDKFGRYLR